MKEIGARVSITVKEYMLHHLVQSTTGIGIKVNITVSGHSTGLMEASIEENGGIVERLVKENLQE